MSVSMRNTKAQMYSEIERLRDYADKQRHQLRAAADEIDRLRVKCQAPNTSEHSSKLSERRIRNRMIDRLAVVCKTTVRWVDDRGFLQYKAGDWAAIPTHTVNFVAKGIEQ